MPGLHTAQPSEGLATPTVLCNYQNGGSVITFACIGPHVPLARHANTLNQTKSESERVLEAVVDVLKQALQRGEKIDLRGLGVFRVRETKPRQARNPRTGEALSIPAKKAAVFKPGKELSALLNTSAEEPDAQAKAVEQPI